MARRIKQTDHDRPRRSVWRAGTKTGGTLDEIKGIVSKRSEVPVEQVTHDTRLEDLGVGSLEVIEIVYDIEEKFGISVPIKPGESSLVLETETDGARSSVKLSPM